MSSFFFIILIVAYSYIATSEAQEQVYLNKITTMGGVGYDICVIGNYAFITGNDGYSIFNIQNPAKTKKVGEFIVNDGAFGIYVREDLAFIASQSQGLLITNISNPSNPTLIGQSAGIAGAIKVFATNNYAYIVSYESGLQIFDINDLANPIKIGEYSNDGRADEVVVVNNIAYVANPNLGLGVINVTQPSAPQKIKTITSAGGATGLSVFEDLLFVGCYSSSIFVFNISSPLDPVLLSVHSDNDGGEAQGVVGNRTHLYVADNFGVEYYDISNLPTIRKIAENRKGVSAAHDIVFEGNFLYVAGGNIRGSLIFEISSSQKSSALGIYIGVPIAIIVATVSFWFIFRLKMKNKNT